MVRVAKKQIADEIYVLSLGFLLWGLWQKPKVWALAASYLVAWAIVNYGLRSWLQGLGVPRKVQVILLSLCALFGGVRLTSASFLKGEGLYRIQESTSDRLSLVGPSSIFPRQYAESSPQAFYVREADPVRSISLDGKEVHFEQLGDDLYRLRLSARETSGESKLSLTVQTDSAQTTHALKIIPARAFPERLCINSDRNKVAVLSQNTDEGVLISAAGEVRHFRTGDGPSDCSFLGHTLIVAHRFENDLHFFEPDARKFVDVGAPQCALSSAKEKVAVALCGENQTLLILENDHQERRHLPSAADQMVFAPGGQRLFLSTVGPNTLSVWDTTTTTPRHQKTRPLARPATAIGVGVAHGKPSLLYFTTTGFSQEGTALKGNHFVQDQIVLLDAETLALKNRLRTAHGDGSQGDPGNITSGGSPLGLSIDQAKNQLLVSFAGTDEIWSLDGGSLQERAMFKRDSLVSMRDVISPQAIALMSDGSFVVVSPTTSGVFLFDTSGKKKAVFFFDEDAEQLRDPVRRGARTFFETTRSGVSCQSCHLRADSDFALHDLGGFHAPASALLPTLSVRGVFGTRPYLRDGSFPTILDLHEKVLEKRLRGFKRTETRRGQDLERFVDSLSLSPNPRYTRPPTEQEQRGYRVFEAAKCKSCHPPPAFTDLGSRAPAWLFPGHPTHLAPGLWLDTPSLIGSFEGAPFLSDGRAKTLESVFSEHNQNDRHGHTKLLSEKDLRDLAAFLRSL